MSAAGIRRALNAVCVAGVAGMIATSIADSPGGALTFGLLTAVAAFGIIIITAVTNGGAARSADELGEAIEDRVQSLVEAGADEQAVRSLVRDAVKLGSSRS
ncbi:MAG: hypothetical protein JWN29_3108 [Acidimicrobiales bacterium]|nr:hypothetical protein [Acidimicrobiales bacterium]